jgi:hypothetical protein
MDSTEPRPVTVMVVFAISYKLVYLALISLNVALLVTDVGLNHGLLQIYFIDIAVLGINVVAWLGYRRGKGWALELEQALSLGRILMVALASTIFLAGVVSLYSPVGWILWYKLMFSVIDEGHRVWYWSGCAILLALESLYFCALTRVSPNEPGPARTEALS